MAGNAPPTPDEPQRVLGLDSDGEDSQRCILTLGPVFT